MTTINILNEEINSGSAIVYHRDNRQRSFEDLLNGKYKAGDGDYYGRGLYTFLDKTSLYHNTSYGRIIYKLRIVNLQNFFFFNVDEYNKIFHSKMKDIKELIVYQVKKFNIKLKGYNSIYTIVNDHVDSESREAKLARLLTRVDVSNLQNRCNGIIYTGGYNDGNVCVIYPHAYGNVHPLEISHDNGKTWYKEIANTTTPREAAKRSQTSPSSSLRDLNDLKKIYSSKKLCVYKQEQPRRYLLTKNDKTRGTEGYEFNEGKGSIYLFNISEKGEYSTRKNFDTDDFTYFIYSIPDNIKKMMERDFGFKFKSLTREEKTFVFPPDKKINNNFEVETTVYNRGSPKRFIDSMFGDNKYNNIVDVNLVKKEKGENGGSVKKRYGVLDDGSGIVNDSRKFTFRERDYETKKRRTMFFPNKKDIEKYFNKRVDDSTYKEIISYHDIATNENGRVWFNFSPKNKVEVKVEIGLYVPNSEKHYKPIIINATKEKFPELWNDFIGGVKKVKRSFTTDEFNNQIQSKNWKGNLKDPKLEKIYNDLIAGRDKDEDVEKYNENKRNKRNIEIGKDDHKIYNVNKIQMSKFNNGISKRTGYQIMASDVTGQTIVGMSNYIFLDDSGDIRVHFKTRDKKVKTVNFNILNKDYSDPKLNKERQILFLLDTFGDGWLSQKIKYMVGFKNYNTIQETPVPKDRVVKTVLKNQNKKVSWYSSELDDSIKQNEES